MRTRTVGAVAVALALTLAACGDDANDDAASAASEATDEDVSEDSSEPGTIVDVAVANGSFTTLVAAVEAAGLVETLSGDGPYTVFAPTDDAFAAALDALGLTADELLADTDTLTSILTYHVLAGEVDAATAISLDGQSAETVNGAEIAISVVDGNVMIDAATVIIPDVAASNGIIHAIDTVLLPPADDMADEEAAGDDMAEDDMAEDDMAEDMGTIVDVAIEDGSFVTLVAAVQAAGLVETLSGEGPFTVFAPTDDAFAALLDDLGVTAEELLADTDLLTSVLTYHVVAGEVPAATVVTLDGQAAETVNGATVDIAVDGDNVMLNDANVIAVDVKASNGIIHVIDSVLLPPADDPGTIVDVAVSNENFVTLVAAVQAADLVETLSGEGPFTVFAPTDDAFAALLDDLGVTAEELLADTDLLTSVLTYHVVAGEVDAATAISLDGQSAETVNGAEIDISVVDGNVMINDATVIAADVAASNGIIHVIDTVLLPPAG